MNLIEAIIAVPDHRHPRGIRHPLWLILTIILLGSCTGYWGYKPLVDFTKNHRETLIKLFNLPRDIRFPSNSTFRQIIHSLDFEILAVLFNVWSQQTLLQSGYGITVRIRHYSQDTALQSGHGITVRTRHYSQDTAVPCPYN